MALGRGADFPQAARPDERWSLDFLHDTLSNGRRIRTLNIVAEFTRETIAIEVDTSISGSRVARVLDRIADERGCYPKTLVMDNGTELERSDACVGVDARVQSHHIAPGKRTQNAFVESFDGKFRDECLNDNIFSTLAEARRIIEAWRHDYNEHRPYRSLGQRTPNEFAAAQLHSAPALHL